MDIITPSFPAVHAPGCEWVGWFLACLIEGGYFPACSLPNCLKSISLIAPFS